MKKYIIGWGLLLALFITLPAFGQKRNKKQEKAQTVEQAVAPAFDASAFQALQWRNIGPFRGGRSNAVSGVRGNPNRYYAGYTGGGLWMTDNAGQSWRNISDGFFETGSVGDIAVSESDPNVIYVGMGEHAVRGVMTTFGDGIYKSTDAGQSWMHLGLEKTRHISDVIIHPDNPDVVYVAAQGALHGPSEERGVYKSTDGGQSWTKVLYVDENTGASSLSMDMNNPRILYAATWEHRRLPWTVQSAGPGCSLWKSTDGGETWNKINNGLPEVKGKMGISVSRADSKRVYAIVEAEKAKAGLYRSDNGGQSWSHLSADQAITSRSWYYMEVFADPLNPDNVVVLNAPMMRSTDGGRNFSMVRVGHGDTHDLWINPDNNQNMILGDDGGAEITFNTGLSWSTLYNQPTAQFYRVNVDHQFPYKVYGGQQDNSSVVIASRTNGPGITEKDWTSGPGCESAYIAFDPDNPVKLYGGCYQGLIDELDVRTMESRDIMQYPSLKLATQPKDMKYRYNWNAPIVASPHDPKTIYHAGNVVFRTRDGGTSWEVISPDLTRDEEEKQGPGGGPLTNEGAGGENYNTIYYLIESELERGVIYTGSDCGLVHVTRDNGATWTNITPPDLPESTIHAIEVSPHEAGTAYVCANRYKWNDFSAMAYKTTDYGQTWTKINNGIRQDDFLRVLREDKKEPGLLYGGGERGFYVSFDGGNNWSHLQLNLPVVPITDLISHDNDLIAATQGRAFWILDDLGALQQSMGSFADLQLQLFAPKPTVKFGGGGGRSSGPNGQNPRSGVVLDYFLAQKPADSLELVLDILDASGKVVRSYSSKQDEAFINYPGGPSREATLPTKKGLNRFAWDFRTENYQDVPNAFVYGSYAGHQVPPGDYRARLSLGDQQSEVPIKLLQDPRLDATPADWQAQQAMLERIRDYVAEINNSIIEISEARRQIADYNDLLKDKEGMEAIVEMGQALVEKIEAWEANVIERRQKNTQDVINWPSRLNVEFLTLKGKLDAHDPQVTQGVKDRLADLEKTWSAYKDDLQAIQTKDIKAYNDLFLSNKIPAVILPK